MTHLLRRAQRVLLTGFFIILPLSLSFLLLGWLVATIDRLLAPLVSVIGRPLPGLGLVMALALVAAAGILGNNIAGQHLLQGVERLLLRIPVFNWLYRTIKQASDVFAPTKKASGARSVAVVEYPRPGVYSVGFATNRFVLESPEGRREMVAVFVPTNHMYIGDTILVPAERVIYTNLTQQEGIQAMISAGAVLPSVVKALPAPEQKKSGPPHREP